MVHVLFEQTNTFRDIFRKKGMSAMSYDIECFFISISQLRFTCWIKSIFTKLKTLKIQ